MGLQKKYLTPPIINASKLNAKIKYEMEKFMHVNTNNMNKFTNGSVP